MTYAPRNPMGSLALWEKKEHGKCGPGHHKHYRIRRPYWVEVRCKLCKHLETELYEDSFLSSVA